MKGELVGQTSLPDLIRNECDVCPEGCFRESLHFLSPLAVLMDELEWPTTHGRIELELHACELFSAEITGSKDRAFLTADSRSGAIVRSCGYLLGREMATYELDSDVLAQRLDALPRWSPWSRIVMRRDQLHIYTHIGRQFGGHGLAESLYNMIRLTYEEADNVYKS